MNLTRGLLAVLLVWAALLFMAGIERYDLWSPDEPRFGEVAREMMQSGNYLVPTINGQPYKEKPPLLFWAIAAVSTPMGDVTEWSARIPSALAALLAVFCTFLLAQRMYGSRVAWWSGMVLTSTALFWWEARTVRTDMLLTASLSVSLLAFWSWHEQRRTAWLALFYAAIAVALLAKGPPALAFPVLGILTFYWKKPSERRQMHWILGVLAALVPVLLWIVPARMAAAGTGSHDPVSGGLGFELGHQIIGRMFMGVSHAQWPWYYLETLPMCWFPWTLLLPWTLPWIWRRRHEGPAMRFLLSWIVPALIFFSISIGKRSIYLLPVYPAAAILVGRSLLDLMDGDHAVWRRRTAWCWAFLLALFAAAAVAFRYTEYRDLWSGAFVLISIVAAGFALDTVRRIIRTDLSSLHAAMLSHFSVLALFCVLLVLPLANPYKSARAVCKPLEALTLAGKDYRLYSVGFSREQYIYYSRHFHEPVLTETVELPAALVGADAKRVAKQQRRIRDAITKAVASVSIDSFAAVNPDQIRTLESALQGAVHAVDVDPAMVDQFEKTMTDAIDQFAQTFEQATPAFMFVQEKDWRWLLPLHPAMAQYPVIINRPVGSRDVLLLANIAGARLLESLPARTALSWVGAAGQFWYWPLSRELVYTDSQVVQPEIQRKQESRLCRS